MCVVWVRFIHYLLPGFEGSGFARTIFFFTFWDFIYTCLNLSYLFGYLLRKSEKKIFVVAKSYLCRLIYS